MRNKGCCNPLNRACFLLVLALLPIEMQSATLPRRPGSLWAWARRQASYEQAVEDANVPFKSQGHLVRELIVMPISAEFAAAGQNPLLGKLQYCDKCSFPASIGRDIYRRPYEVPWIFEITRVDAGPVGSPETTYSGVKSSDKTDAAEASRVYASPLDFRSPENYIFMPDWMMRSLRIEAQDRVLVRFVRIQLSTNVALQPLNKTWDTVFMSRGDSTAMTPRDPTSVLEEQLNKYSALTSGTTIPLEIEGNEYYFLVNETRGETGAAVYGVRVQDADVNVDIDRSFLDEHTTT